MLSGNVLAEIVSPTPYNTDWVIGLSAGSTWVSGNKSQTINLQPDIAKTYTASHTNNVIPSFELFVGAQKPLTTRLTQHPVLGQLGLSIAEAGNANLTGDIWEDANPNFDNFNYKYKVNHTFVGLKGRLTADSGFIVDPYISGSVGVGFNRAYNFVITPIISNEVAPPAFASNTTATFSYTLGIGLQKTVAKNLQVAIGYEFADWGMTSLSRAAGQTTGSGPTLNHLYAQTLQLSLFYV